MTRNAVWLAMTTMWCVGAPAFAQMPTATWIATSGSWNTPGNWSPSLPASGPNTVLQFNTSSSAYTATNNLGDFALGGFVFGGTVTGPISIANDASSTITLETNGTVLPTITMASSGSAQFLPSAGINLSATAIINGAGSGSLTFMGPVSGVGGLTINRQAGATYLLANNTFAGPVDVRAGTLVLAGEDGTARSAASLSIGPGGALHMIDQPPPVLLGRFGDTTPVTLAGTLSLDAGFAGITLQRLGSLSLPLNSASTLTVAAGLAGSAQLYFDEGTGAADLLTSARTAILFRGTRLGMDAPGTAGSTTISFAHLAPATLVGGGAPGTPSIGILPFAVGDTQSDGTGAGFVTVDPARGIRLLDAATEYASLSGFGASDNVRITASATNVVGQRLNSLAVAYPESGSAPLEVVGLSGTTLTVTSGALLFTSDALTPADMRLSGFEFVASDNRTAMIHVSGAVPPTATITSTLAGTGGFVKSGNGTLVLAGPNANAGGVTLGAGTLVIGHDAALGIGPFSIAGGTVRADANRILSNSVSILADCTFGGGPAEPMTFQGGIDLGAIAGPAITRTLTFTNTTTWNGVVRSSSGTVVNLIKSGAGTLVFGQSAEYVGSTRIAAGRLLVNGSMAGAGPESLVSVQSNGLLGGRGTIARPISIATGGTLAPGDDAPGRLTVTSPIALAGGANFEVALNGATAGAGYSQLDLSGGGSISLGGANLVTTLGYAPSPTDSLFIVIGGTVNGTFAGRPDGANFAIGSFSGLGYNATIHYQTNAVYLTGFTPVPEPSAVLCISLFGSIGFVVRRAVRGRFARTCPKYQP